MVTELLWGKWRQIYSLLSNNEQSNSNLYRSAEVGLPHYKHKQCAPSAPDAPGSRRLWRRKWESAVGTKPPLVICAKFG